MATATKNKIEEIIERSSFRLDKRVLYKFTEKSSTTIVVPPSCAQTDVMLSAAKRSEAKSKYILSTEGNNQEDRVYTRTQKETKHSNRTKTISNQKGAHYVKQ